MKQDLVQVPRFDDWGSQARRKKGVTAAYNTASRFAKREEISYKQGRKLYNLYNNVNEWNPSILLRWGVKRNPVKFNLA